MKKLVIGVLIVGIAIFGYGNYYYNKKIEKIAEVAKIQDSIDQIKEVQKKQEEINKLKPNGQPESVVDTLRYFILTNGKAKISTLGSSVTFGSGATDEDHKWINLLINQLKIKNNLNNLTYKNNGFSGYATRAILAENKVDIVIKQKPDVVLFEDCILNDHGQSIPIQQTLNNIDQIVEKLKTDLPNARIILTSPNPSSIKVNEVNSIGLKYSDYIEKTKEHIQSKKWEYVDIYADYEKQLADNKIELVKTLKDGIHPNDIGYGYWETTLFNYFQEKH